ERLQTRTSCLGKMSAQVASVPLPTEPAPTIASTLESLRASHLADTAADETDPTPAVTDAPTADVDAGPAPATTAPTDDSTPAESTPAGSEPEREATAPEILQVAAPLVGGGELDLATVGDRPLLLWFWAPF
ncbi:MAG: hypothetical protein WD225_09155, partial [Ilumatobacteraceae bacterium]